MSRTYEAILLGDHLTWTGETPDPNRPTRVDVTLMDDEASARERGRKMAEALEKLAQIGAFSTVKDPIAWQREIRQDRPLPGRES